MYTGQVIPHARFVMLAYFFSFLLARNACEASCFSLTHPLHDTSVQRFAGGIRCFLFLQLQGRHEGGDHLAERTSRVAVAHLRQKDAFALHGVAQLQFWCDINSVSKPSRSLNKTTDC
jgi:hypothetical protein